MTHQGATLALQASLATQSPLVTNAMLNHARPARLTRTRRPPAGGGGRELGGGGSWWPQWRGQTLTRSAQPSPPPSFTKDADALRTAIAAAQHTAVADALRHSHRCRPDSIKTKLRGESE